MFAIPEFTEAHLASVTNRVEKHGDDDKKAVTIGVEITTANTMLDAIDPKLREAMFKPKPDAEPELPGVEISTPILRCNSIDRVVLPTKHEGWTLAIDDGIEGDADPMLFGSVKVDKLSVEPKQGGSIVLRMRLGTSDVDADKLGWLGMHNGEEIWIKLTPPPKPADVIDGSTEAFERDHPDAGGQADLLDTEAGDAFAAEHGQPGPEDEGDGTDGAAGGPDAGASETEGVDHESPKPRSRRSRKAAEVE
ncbi:MAG: hypothetical protein RJA36_3384 [Pseudomonadota bacterium]|jgi:hypothetical protein